MKITEKMYIEWLEKLVKEYKEDLCDHCPKEEVPVEIREFLENACVICHNLTEKYADAEDVGEECPCHYFEFDDEDVNMVKVAWKVIRGWKKDNKQEVADG